MRRWDTCDNLLVGEKAIEQRNGIQDNTENGILDSFMDYVYIVGRGIRSKLRDGQQDILDNLPLRTGLRTGLQKEGQWDTCNNVHGWAHGPRSILGRKNKEGVDRAGQWGTVNMMGHIWWSLYWWQYSE